MTKRITVPADRSLTDLAYAHLEEMIVTLKLAPGRTVSEGELSVLTGIGRTPIREALQRLAREKLVSILPRRGIVVTEINVGSQLRLLEVRRELERLIARSAARRATDAERDRFREIARLFEKSAREDNDVAFMRTDREFNTLCSAASHNDFAAGAMSLMHSLSRRFWYIH
jgi:DNA-binding GntR family transcriptional regulator